MTSCWHMNNDCPLSAAKEWCYNFQKESWRRSKCRLHKTSNFVTGDQRQWSLLFNTFSCLNSALTMHVADKNTVMHFWNCLKSHSGLKKTRAKHAIKLKQNQHFRAHQDKIVTFFRRGYNVVVGDNAQFVNQTVHEGRWERKVIERIKNVQCPEAVWHRRAALQIDHYLLPFINQCIQNNHSIRREAFRKCPFTSMSFPFRLWIAPMGIIGSRAIYFIYNCKKQAGCTGTQWHVLSGFPSVDGSPLLRFNTVDSAALTHSAVLIKPFHNTNAYLLVGLTVIIMPNA